MNTQISKLDKSYYTQSLELIRSNNHNFNWSDIQIFDSFENDNSLAFGIFIDNNLVGISLFSFILDESELLYITIDNQLRNKKLAEMLLNSNIFFLKEKKIKNLYLEVDIKNSTAIKLYEKLDFKKISVRKNYYTYPNGVISDAFIYKLEI